MYMRRLHSPFLSVLSFYIIMTNKSKLATDTDSFATTTSKITNKKLSVNRFFSTNKDPFSAVSWVKKDVEITDEQGAVIFSQKDVAAPESWSDLAVKVVVSKYFYGEHGTPQRENSIRQLIHRVCNTITDWGIQDGYFTDKTGKIFYDELATLCLNQYGAFNSPVWFNVGLYHEYNIGDKSSAGNWYYDSIYSRDIRKSDTQYEYPQCSACFIQSVEDNMESIMGLVSSEARLFKFGSGTGTDLSSIRASKEKLSGGGQPSGPMSFLKIYDQVANVVKSGGKTRRAAKMNTLCDWHGDIEEFIDAKKIEEKKVRALIAQGYDSSFNGEAYGSAMYQNENLSVRVSDDFMRAVEAGESWETRAVTTGEVLETKDARTLFRKIAEGTWECGDPGIQFDDKIQEWHTCKKAGRINSSNPCSEYLFIDDSSCNLASLNLCKFVKNGKFDVTAFSRAVELFIIAQDILIDRSSYPTVKIVNNSIRYRPLGLGYANLGSLLMQLGMAYDSERSRRFAGFITGILTGIAYSTSNRLAGVLGPFSGYPENESSFIDVISKHRDEFNRLYNELSDDMLSMFTGIDDISGLWDNVYLYAKGQGFRNAQVTALAPTGTISFMMDCNTTGVEPEIALVKYKFLVGGGMLKLVNGGVPKALKKLGYTGAQIKEIEQYIDTYETIEPVTENGITKSVIKNEHLPVFDCAFKPRLGSRFISWEGHLRMMSAIQPFLSGAISKTVNMPAESTVDDIAKAYQTAWKLGLKCVAIYRDGSKSQPVRTTSDKEEQDKPVVNGLLVKSLKDKITELETVIFELKKKIGKPVRHKLPDTRNAVNHKFEIGGHEGYLTVGLYADGQPGEIFVTMAKEGSTIAGLMDSLATLASLALQYGVPLEDLVRKFAYQRFEPLGMTANPDIRQATSIIDYIFRWLELQFLGSGDGSGAGVGETRQLNGPGKETTVSLSDVLRSYQLDAPLCPYCGQTTVRNGSCYKCLNCGESLGCS